MYRTAYLVWGVGVCAAGIVELLMQMSYQQPSSSTIDEPQGMLIDASVSAHTYQLP